jgi:glucosamine--fructose-6-phosphate aminotransferase (isomerizing)
MTSQMLREIEETPDLVARLIDEAGPEISSVASTIRRRSPRWATFVARGTSDHAGTFARYLFESRLGIRSAMAATSTVNLYRAELDWSHGLVVAVSQSGQSPDVCDYLSSARAGGALTLAITNDVGSPLAGAAELVIDCHAGTEQSVPATKTYVAELVSLAFLVAAMPGGSVLTGPILELPFQLQDTMRRAREWLSTSGVIAEFASHDGALILGRGHNLATALETALKLKETARIFAEAYSTADFEHGPTTLAAVGVPTLAFRPRGAVGRMVDDTLRRVVKQSGSCWVVGDEPSPLVTDRPALVLSPIIEELSPIPFVVPGQLLAEAVARSSGLDPDAPVGLSKVTLTS